jgi:NitT/TauT family transport system permease protein
MIVKAETLSASTWLIGLRVVLPQVMPRLLDSLRLQLGPAFLFLIAAEAISAEAGLGYRIFLVRRYLSMDIIFPYVIWITLLAVMMDLGLRLLRRRVYPWAEPESRS